MMDLYQYQPRCSSLTTSSQTLSSLSSDDDDDELGLKGLVHRVYAPYLMSELERLFVIEVSYVWTYVFAWMVCKIIHV